MKNNVNDLYLEYGAFLTVYEVMKVLKLSRGVVDRLIKSGQLPAAKLGGQYRIRTVDLELWWNGKLKENQCSLLKNLASSKNLVS